MNRYYRARNLHPGAWWVWALGTAVAVSRTTNPLVLGLVIACLGLVVAARRTDAPWALAFRLYLGLAVFIVLLRTAVRIVFSADGPTVLFTLPTIPLPGFLTGAALLGPVSAEALLAGAYSGLQLGTIIVCVGAANALANPRRLLAAMPGALYELGSVVVIAASVWPQLAESVQRVNRARLLRAGGTHRRHIIREVFLPVFADALDRSLALAGAMDSRGYGRRADVPATRRRLTSMLLLLAVIALCAGAYAALDPSTIPVTVGVPVLAGGLAAAAFGLWLAGRWTPRTRYRPDPWRLAETVAACCGLVPAVALAVLGRTLSELLYPSIDPLTWPTMSLPVLAVLVAIALPAVLTPPPKATS